MVRPRDWIPPFRPGENDAYNAAHRKAFYAYLGLMPGAAVSPERVEAADAHAHKVAQTLVKPPPDVQADTFWKRQRGTDTAPLKVLGILEGFVIARYRARTPFAIMEREFLRQYERIGAKSYRAATVESNQHHEDQSP